MPFTKTSKSIQVAFLLILGIFASANLSASELGICGDVLSKLSNWMKPGVYRGLSPTDEGPLAVGELQVTITDKEVIGRMATGLEIQEYRVPLSEFVQMTEEEMKPDFQEGSTAYKDWVGFKHKEFSAPRFLIPKKASWLGPRVFVKMGELPDMLGPTMLYSPLQGKLGITSLNFGLLEFVHRRGRATGHVMIPRLKYNGTTDTSNQPLPPATAYIIDRHGATSERAAEGKFVAHHKEWSLKAVSDQGDTVKVDIIVEQVFDDGQKKTVIVGSLDLPKSKRADVSAVNVNWDKSTFPKMEEMGFQGVSGATGFYWRDKILPALKNAELRTKLVSDAKGRKAE